MIQISGIERKQELKNIWMQCYDDSESYVDFFFKYGFEKCICISEIIDDIAVGALYLFDCKILPKKTPGFYWYAGGVLPSYRNKGVYRKIVSYALKLAESESRVSLCVPGPGLTDFYESFGLKDHYFCDVFQLNYDSSAEIIPIKRRQLVLENYCSMTESTKKFYADGSVVWDKDVLEYILEENKYCNGFCDKLCIDNNEYYLLGQRKGSVLNISETSISYPILKKIKNSLLKLYDAQSIRVLYPTGDYDEDEKKMVLTCIGDGEFNNIDKWFVMTML